MGAARRSALRFATLAFYIIVILVATPQAQQPVSFSGSPTGIVAGPPATPTDATDIDLLVGRSTILNVGSTIAHVSLTVPDVADAMVTAPQQLLIHGKTPGTISLFVWDRAGGIKTYEVNVRRDLKQLIEQMTQLFPGEPITVVGSGKDVVLSGTVSSKYVIDKAADIAAGYAEKKENVVNLLKQQEGVASNQVLLRVRFAEVSRTALQELGATFIANGYKNDWFGRTTTQQFSAPDFDSNSQQGLTFSDFLNIFLFNRKQQIGTVIKALQQKGLFQSLAEPNLIALNGKEASFLAGGEFPVPVVQSGAGNNAVTIMFKEFGIRLNFTPTVLGNDLINLKVRPEVSALDFANGVQVGGFRVPALSTRRTETEVELQNGQTFAIAGLMNNTVNSTMSKIPGIGDIPILGYLFKSRSYQKAETELVVMITPQIVQRGSTGVSSSLPSIVEPYLGAPGKTMAQPAPYTGSPRYPVNAPAAGAPRTGAANDPNTAQPADATSAPAPATTNTAATSSAAQPKTTTAAPMTTAPMAVSPATPQTTGSAQQSSADPKPTKAEQKALEQQQAKDREQAKKDADAEAKAQVAAAKKAQAEKERDSKLAAEQQKKDAEAAKKAAEADRKKQEEQKKKDKEKALADAAARLKQAQAEYDKTKGGK